MKIILHKKTKQILLTVLSAAVIFFGVQIIKAASGTETINQEIVLYEYSVQPKINYEVYISPNEVYSGTVQEEGLDYSKRLFESVKAKIGIDYLSDRPVPLDIEYQMVAKVTAYKGSDQDKVIFWSKTYPLSDKKKFETESGNWSGEQTISFNLTEYDAFAVRAKEITGIKASNEVTVSMTGTIEAHTPVRDVTIPIDVSLRAPLLEDVFHFEKSNTETVTDSITKTEAVPAPVNKTWISFCSIFMTLCLAGIVVLLFFTREPNRQEVIRRRVNAIIKNYGSYIVALQDTSKNGSDHNLNFEKIYMVDSIKDLIKVADERHKPIFHQPGQIDMTFGHEFCLIDGEDIYRWVIT